MRTTLIAFLIATFCTVAQAQLQTMVSEYNGYLGESSSSTRIMQNSPLNRGKDMRPKTVLKGVLYFGGSDRRRALLSSGTQQFLCESGFSTVYSVYDTPKRSSISCSGHTTAYRKVGEAPDSGNGSRVRTFLEDVYDVIQANGSLGPIYLHCWYGVHASNTLAQIALKQFCGTSDSQLASNWDKVDLYDSLGAKGARRQVQKIFNFTPYSDLMISAGQRQQICH